MDAIRKLAERGYRGKGELEAVDRRLADEYAQEERLQRGGPESRADYSIGGWSVGVRFGRNDRRAIQSFTLVKFLYRDVAGVVRGRGFDKAIAKLVSYFFRNKY